MSKPAPANPTRNVSLTARLSAFVDEQVESGRYQNASEVVRAGLRLMEEREKAYAARLAAFNAAVQEGLDELDRGEGVEVSDIGAFFDDLEAEVEAERRSSAKPPRGGAAREVA